MVGGAFGSYGWSGEAAQRLEDALRGSQLRAVAPAVRCKLDPDSAGLQACRALGSRGGRANQRNRSIMEGRMEDKIAAAIQQALVDIQGAAQLPCAAAFRIANNSAQSR